VARNTEDDCRFLAHRGVVAVDRPQSFTNAITVEAHVHARSARPETIQSIVAQWRCPDAFGSFAAYDASNTAGMDTTGFFGAVFDGRYVYFSPQHDRVTRHGKVLRFDTHGDFKSPDSWQAYDASDTAGLNCKGYYGAVFDGRYVIFPPRREPNSFHSRALRYDTRADFLNPESWTAFDVGVSNSSQSAAFDGRYIYFNPGQRAEKRSDINKDDDSPRVTGFGPDQVLIASGNIIRYDTQGDFDQKASWTTFDAAGIDGLDTRDFDGSVFDGRYIYFAPLAFAAALRYDTTRDFHDRKSFQAYDCAKRFGMKRNVGAIFDGRYIYYVPYGECPVAVRFDTAGDFHDANAWSAFKLANAPGLSVLGFDGACFDGRYIYYIPYWDEGTILHGQLLRYDTTADFSSPSSWSTFDAGMTDSLQTTGFNAAAFDGRFIYCATWIKDQTFRGRIGGAGKVLRYDTTGDHAAFDLRFCDLGHNGGLCAALPGPRFLVNTDRGVISIAANRLLPAGVHHLVGIYDGARIRLYINGQCVNEQPATGAVINVDTPVTVGNRMDGEIRHAAVFASAKSSEWVAAQSHDAKV